MKLAAYVAADAPTVIECDAAPPSLQLENTYCVPTAPASVVATAIVCEPCDKFSVCGAVYGVPSTLNWRFGGLVWIVTLVVVGEIVIVKDFDAEDPQLHPVPTLSVTETEKVTGNPEVEVGVPLRTPVEGFSDNPGGSDPEYDHV